MIASLLSAATLALPIAALVLVAHRRKHRRTTPEALVWLLHRVGSWLIHVGLAIDAAIVRYRMREMDLTIQVDATDERLARLRSGV